MDKPNNNKEAATIKKESSLKNKSVKQKWSTKKKIIVIVGGVVAFFVLIFLVASLATSAPLKVSDEFIDDIQANNASAAYDLMSSEAQIATSSQDFTSVVEKISPILTGEAKNTDKSVTAETGSDPKAEILYEIKGNDGLTYQISVQLVQKDGRWLVQGFDSKTKN